MKTLLTTIISLFLFNLLSIAQTPGEIGPLTSIDSYTTFQGYEETLPHLGQGEYQIFYDNIDGVLDKALLIVDGFDPEDINDTTSIYNSLVYGNPPQNYLDNLRDLGIDIVILNFPTYTRPSDSAIINGGADYIERNGLILVNLLEILKNDLVGNEEFIIVGPSMGGLVSRYALTYMEQNTLDHQTGLWISFDSPHLGANIPISFQYAVNYIAEQTGDADMIHMRDVQLNSPAAKQLLLDHYTSHLQSGSPFLQDLTIQLPTPNTFRDDFMLEMNSLGFPTQTRNLSIANGSLNSSMVETPGTIIMDTSLDFGGNAGADIALHFTPAANISNYEIDYIQPTFIGVPFGDAFYAYAESPSYTAGLDSAPGGTILFENFFGANPTPAQQEIIDALQVDAFSFIPALSSMAIEELNWYNSIDGTEVIPFDDFIGNNINEPHLTLNQAYIDFLNLEILNFYLDTPDSSIANNITLLGNPVSENINIRLDNNYLNRNLIISILNSTGQLISTYKAPQNQEIISIPSPSADGFYYMTIVGENSQAVMKIIVQN